MQRNGKAYVLELNVLRISNSRHLDGQAHMLCNHLALITFFTWTAVTTLLARVTCKHTIMTPICKAADGLHRNQCKLMRIESIYSATPQATLPPAEPASQTQELTAANMRGYAEATTVYNHFDLYLLWVTIGPRDYSQTDRQAESYRLAVRQGESQADKVTGRAHAADTTYTT
ncbi:MAG: hypothetical protein FRX49_10705 [Trebouxia sp. A1-2]|nr:MAG: hypothetical protein FRX49_10705 [Trebouxia sp. A1-2]